jgi:arylformamidase
MILYQGYNQEQLDHQYNARATVPDTGVFIEAYASESTKARSRVNGVRDVAYGAHPDELLDIFPAPQADSPVFVFIHGGYWRALSKDDSAFMAETFTKAGATVIAVNYSLAPAASLHEIVAQNRRALAWIHANIARYHGDPKKIYLCGSSAGGHLVGMLLAGGWHAQYGVPEDVVAGACPISGLFDLTPIPHTHINAWTKLDADSAYSLSPQFHLPAVGAPLLVSYGEYETAEFKRQSDSYLTAWRAKGFAGDYVEMPGTNHFDVVLKLAQPDSALTQAILRMMGLS